MTHTPSLRRMARTWEQSVAGRLSSLKWSYLHRLNIRAFQQLLSILRICCSANFNSFHSTPPTFLEWWWKLSEGWCLKSPKRASEREVTNDKTQSGPTDPTGVQRRRGGNQCKAILLTSHRLCTVHGHLERCISFTVFSLSAEFSKNTWSAKSLLVVWTLREIAAYFFD